MRRRPSSIAIVVIICTCLMSVLPNAAVAAPGGGNSANAAQCQKGGWQQLQRTDGSRFSNQGDCVSYAAQGGALVPIAATPVVQMIPDGGADVPCSWAVIGTGFLPLTTYHYQIFLSGTSLGPGFDIMSDSGGSTGSGFGMEPGIAPSTTSSWLLT
jgi:hypothetical protein